MIPNPIDAVGGWFSDTASDAGKSVLKFVIDFFVGAIANACKAIAAAMFGFLNTSSAVHLDQGFWAGPRAQHLFATVLQLSAVLMLGFFLLALIHGLIHGDPVAMLRTAFGRLPASIFGTVALVAVTELLLQLTDAMSAAVLGGTADDLTHFLDGFGNGANLASNGLAGVVFFLLFLLGALLIWIELVIRSSLIYLLIALAPLLLAARVWTPAAGGFRRLCELGIALIAAKFGICLALAVGAAALAGGGPGPGGSTGVALDLNGLLVGSSLMLLAAFTPFVLLKLMPIAEAALVAHGIKAAPYRAGMAGTQLAYYQHGLRRIGGGGPGGSAPSPAGGPPGGGGGLSPAGATAAPLAGGGSSAAAGAAAPTVGAAAVPVMAAASLAARAAKSAQSAANLGPTGSSSSLSPTSSPGGDVGGAS
jgi:hypothetical protein